jgi:hypothetical protein
VWTAGDGSAGSVLTPVTVSSHGPARVACAAEGMAAAARPIGPGLREAHFGSACNRVDDGPLVRYSVLAPVFVSSRLGPKL